MSKSQSIAFFEEISKNKQLAQEVDKIVGGKNSDETKAKELISLAKEHGFNFTQKEAASAQGELKKSLSPEELLEVSGGKGGFKSSFMAMALLTGLGVGGVAMSSMKTSAMDGDNHQEIQVPGGQAAEQQEGNAQPGQQQQGAEGNQEQPGQQNAAAQAEQQQQWVCDGRHTVDASHFIEVQGPGGLVATGDGGQVDVTGDRIVNVISPGQWGVFVFGDREVQVHGPGQQAVFVNGGRRVEVNGPGGALINRPGGHGAGERPEISVAPPVLQNPDRGPQEAPVYAPRDVELNEVRTVVINGAAQVDINCPCDVTHNGSGGQLTVTGSASISAEGTNRVNAGADSTIYSVSSNLFTHDGMGGGIIDGGDIEFSGFTEDRPTRNVTVQDANSVTVASGLTMRTQNGTEFTMGETLQETAENILRALTPNSLQEILSKFGSSSGGK